MAESKQVEFLPARVTFLEMREKPQRFIAESGGLVTDKKLTLMRAENCPIHFYRYLYERVGRPHHWHMRRVQSDEAVAVILRAAATYLHILYYDGCPAGFSETIITEKENKTEAELLYFGLMPEYQGLRISGIFLRKVLEIIWEKEVSKISIQTNSLDSPRALQLYQQAGFVPTAVKNVEIEAWT